MMMQKKLVALLLVVGFISISISNVAHGATTSVPFVYDTWSGIPSDQIRLKAYCENAKWRLNAVANPGNKVPLSTAAIDYLATLEVPSGACTNGSSIGSAFWDPNTDSITLD